VPADSLPDPAAAPRCFVASWPRDEARQALAAAAGALKAQHPGARIMPAANLHLTLAFLGPLPEDHAARVAAMLARLPFEPFTWTLDHLGSFPGARVAWAGGPTDPRLASLTHAVRGGLDTLGLRYDARPLVPHVTLLRDFTAPRLDRAMAPLAWPVDAPRLVVSERAPGGPLRYRPWG
jgi:RNA 2',3'-cyclic 3'-phosphodiesterase